MSGSSEIIGAISKITYERDGFVIAHLANGPAIKGNMLKPLIGAEYRFFGTHELHARFGDTFKFTKYESLAPTSPKALLAYLGETASWIGPAIAKRIVDQFGADSITVLKDMPETVAQLIKGITLDRAHEISADLKANAANEANDLSLRDALEGIEIGKSVFQRIAKAYGSDAAAVVKSDPYRLAHDIDGISFIMADKIAKRNGVRETDPKRLVAGLRHVLSEASFSQGHVFLPKVEALGEARRVLGQPRNLIEAAIHEVNPDDVLYDSVGNTLSLRSLSEAERYVAEALVKLANTRCDTTEFVSTNGLVEDQITAVTEALRSSVTIISGSAGTGKSTCVERLAAGLGDSVALCGPTGKSARRLSELCLRPAATIHALLGARPNGNGFSYMFNETCRLPHRMIVVDELSMVSVDIMAALLRAINPGTRLVLLGDPYQLPSVGPGSILKDLIASGVIAHVELKTIKRQNPGMIISNAARIRDGRDIDTSNQGPEFEFIHAHTEDDVHEALLMTMGKYSTMVSDPLLDIQVITALREKTNLSVRALNQLLREHHHFLAGNGIIDTNWKRPFVVGDKVIYRKNDYQLGVMNGDIGVVADVARDGQVTVEFRDPARKVIFPYENRLELAFCNTVHASQGSGWPIVVVICHPVLGQIVPTRPWIYTAVTRAIKHCIVIGQREEISKVIRRNQSSNRWTNLKALLQNEVVKPQVGGDSINARDTYEPLVNV